MSNRVKDFVSDNISNDFDTYSSVAKLELFEALGNVSSLESLVREFIKKREEEAKKQGIKETIETIEKEVRSQIEGYILLLTKIVDFVKDSVNKVGLASKVEIVSSRTNFFFDTKWISILFVIKSEIQTEIDFSNLLTQVQNIIFQKEGFLSELLYVNSQKTKIDEMALSADYPYFRKSGEKNG